ncbi:DUF4174 domain-containing protein [Oceaniglobus trochenteri]|uniref:DUF4174 domain-containing protein n=1 Tax=Oceaniglobus trochenteri TaxID=2763260 RepID=UPI001D000E6E|nr:DUF4174 domain-containing protein [Oceaniglobus trochenteri]
MRTLLALAVSATLALAGLSAAAQSAETPSALERWQADPTTVFKGAEISLADFQWIARPVVVFANTEADPSFQDQIRLFAARPGALAERDVVLITDTDPAGRSEIRLKLRPRGFMLALLGKDGQVKLRKPLPWDVRELTRVIDKMPMRQREMNESALGN